MYHASLWCGGVFTQQYKCKENWMTCANKTIVVQLAFQNHSSDYIINPPTNAHECLSSINTILHSRNHLNHSMCNINENHVLDDLCFSMYIFLQQNPFYNVCSLSGFVPVITIKICCWMKSFEVSFLFILFLTKHVLVSDWMFYYCLQYDIYKAHVQPLNRIHLLVNKKYTK